MVGIELTSFSWLAGILPIDQHGLSPIHSIGCPLLQMAIIKTKQSNISGCK